MISPTSWLTPSADLKGQYIVDGKDRLWDVFESYSTLADIDNVAKHFPGVGSSFGWTIVDKSGHDGLKFVNGHDTSLGFLPRSGIEEVKQQLHATDNIGSRFKIDQSNKPRLRVSTPISRVLSPSSIEIVDAASNPTAGSKNYGLYLYTYVDDMATAQQVQSRIIDCISILNTHCHWVGFMNIKAFKMISLAR
jgi:hypothetical protein